MTDKEKFLALMEEFGLSLREYEYDASGLILDAEGNEGGEKFDGYDGFFQVWFFDGQGAFTRTGAWE